MVIITEQATCIPRQLKAREAEDKLRAQEELNGCRTDGGPPKPPPPGGAGSGGVGVLAVAATAAKAAVSTVVDLPPVQPPPPASHHAMPPPSYSSAANPLLNELTSSPPAINDRTPVSDIEITVQFRYI